MKPEEIKQALEAKGFNIKIVSGVLKKTPLAVGNVINRRLTSRKIAVALSKIIEKDVREVFPDVASYHLSPEEILSQKEEQIRDLLRA